VAVVCSDPIVPRENPESKITRGQSLHAMAAMLALTLSPVKHNQYPVKRNLLHGCDVRVGGTQQGAVFRNTCRKRSARRSQN
jgi:hypothetical protein